MTTFAVGIVLPTMSERGTVPGDVAAAARHAEELGFESVWVIDQLVAGTGVPLLDSGIALAAAAAATSRVGRLPFYRSMYPQVPSPTLKVGTTRGMQAFSVDDARLSDAIGHYAPSAQIVNLG